MRKGRWFTKGIVFLVVLLFFLQSPEPVSAREIFSGWVTSEESFTAEDMAFAARYITDTGRLVINTTDDRVVLSKGDCKRRDELQFCFLDVDHDSHARYEHGKEYAGVNILITLLEPVIRIERSASNAKPKLMERFTIEGKIKNIGDINANNIIYEDVFPPWVRVAYATIPYAADRVRMSVSYLAPGNERPFRYVLEPSDYTELDSAADVTYDSISGSSTVKSDPIHIEVVTPFTIKENFSSHIARLNEPVEYTIIITNKDKRSDLTVNEFSIQIPSGIDVVSFSNNLQKNDKSGRTLSFTKSIESIKRGDKETLLLQLAGKQEGKYVLSTLASFTVNNKALTQELRQKLTVSSSDIVPELELKPEQAKEGGYYYVRAVLANQGEEDISDVDTSISGVKELPLDFNNRAVLKGRTLEIYDARLPVPEVNATTTKIIELKGSYTDAEGEAGQRYPFAARENITFIPGPKVLELRHDVPSAIVRGGNATVIVYAKNLKNKPLTAIEVATSVPKGGRVLEGNPYGTLSLAPNEEKETYHFTLQILPNYRKDALLLKTTANTDLEGEFIQKKREVMVDILDRPLAGEALSQESGGANETTGTGAATEANETKGERQKLEGESTEEAPLQEQQRKEGFLARLFRFLGQLFD